MTLLADYSAHLATLLPTVTTPAFPLRLIELFKALVSLDDATIVVYPNTDLPVIEYFEPSADGSSRLDLFANGAFLLDPYYQAATCAGKAGFFRLQELAPDGFRKSEYYRSWYRECRYQDECGYLVPISSAGFVNISLARSAEQAAFGRKQLNILGAITPLVNTLCRQHWGHSISPAQDKHNLRGQLQSALEAFASSRLTNRESQVINLVLRGHSTRTIAEKLAISIETVKLHRKHAYAKLDIGSQAELFYLFLDSLMSAEDYSGGDTLEAYLDRADKENG